MDILKRVACRVLVPLLLTAGGLLLIVVVPMNGSQFLETEEVKVQDSERVEYNTEGLIYMDITESSNEAKSDSQKFGSSQSR